MELEKCSYDAIGENICCCKNGPFEGSENLQFKSVIENYDDYLNNKRFIERKRKECNDRQSAYQKQENENRKMLKNVFLNEFIGSEKQIKGLCVHEKSDLSYQDYLYIVDVRPNNIHEGGLYAPVIRISFREENGDLTNISIHHENSYPISYETLCSCRITEQEFMDVYNRANNKIMEQLGLIKVDSE